LQIIFHKLPFIHKSCFTMKKYSLSLIIFFAVLLSQATHGQNVAQDIRNHMDQVRKGNNPFIPESILNTKDALATIKLAEQYYGDSIRQVRDVAYNINYRIGLKQTDPNVRQIAVENLIKGLNDSDAGNIGMLLGYITAFAYGDFNEKARVEIKSALHKEMPYYNKLLLLAGFLQMTDEIPYIREQIFTNEKIARRDKMAGYFALARLGDEATIETLVSRASRLPLNSDAIYDVYPDLIYTRRPEIYKIMIDGLFNDTPSCESADPHSSNKILCGYRIMEYLAPVIKDFPVKTNESGDIDTQDYNQALLTVRKWFEDKQFTYDIDKNGF
jgi:hypothetical protein